MAHVASPSLVRQLGSLFEGGSTAGLSDRQLLERFTARDDPAAQAAFAAIVARHGPMVLGVCRQLLGDHHLAEDAFQAVFLVLARRARSIRNPDQLGPWLHGVSLRTARKTRGRLARRRQIEEAGAVGRPEARPAVQAEQVIDRERAEALHREIDRLPGSFRLAVVLCYFEGLSPDEAADRLRWPGGTLRSRLVRARHRLRRGLARRGIVLSGTALAAVLAPRSSSASVSSPLCDITTRAAMNFAAGHAAAAPSATALAQEVLRSMLIHKLKLTAFALMLLGAVATGAGFLTHALAVNDEPRNPPSAPQPQISVKADSADPKPSPGRMIVVGRVLDPAGKPVASASVMVYATLRRAEWRLATRAPGPIGQARGDASGRFRLDAPRTSSSSHYDVGAAAVAPGYGTSWVDLDPDADQPSADITLRPEQVIHGRAIDIQGQPVAGVAIAVEGMGRAPRGPESLPLQIEGAHFWGGNTARSPVSGWPKPATSDAEGRFTVHGAGRGLRVLLIADDPRFARQRIIVDTDNTSDSKSITITMEPAKVFTGRVTDADTGKPVPHAPIEIDAFRGGPSYPSFFETDGDGHFRANPFSTDRYQLAVVAPAGDAYLNAATQIFTWTKGSVERRIDIALHRGVSIHGKVTEEGSGRPVAGATIGYHARGNGDNPPGETFSFNGQAESAPDGSYQLAVLPGPGTIVVQGPSDDYVLQPIGKRMLEEGQPGGSRLYVHASTPRDLKPGAGPQEVHIRLRRGITVKGQALDPGGQPVRNAWIFSTLVVAPQPWPARNWSGRHHVDVHDGRFELHGIDPDAEVSAFFLDPEHKRGAAVNLSSKSIALMTIATRTGRVEVGATARFSGESKTRGPITVRLQPCGTATARLVDPEGKPLAAYRDLYLISMVVTPGPDRMSNDPADKTRLSAEQGFLSDIDPIHYAEGCLADAEGRITFSALIPGATYRVFDRTARNADGIGRQIRKEFTVKPGENLDLGDIRIEKPEA
jgi:RNA polymerase sigma factor (sigma-70 family)